MSHTVITTTTTSGRTAGDGGLNAGYTRTIPGLLKIGQMLDVLSGVLQLALLVAFLCVRCVKGWPSWPAFQYFEVVSLWFLIALLIFFLMHLFRLQGKMPCINWPLTEFFHYSVGTVLIFIASIVAAVKAGGVSALVAASVVTTQTPGCIGTVRSSSFSSQQKQKQKLFTEVFGFIATFLMAVSLWTSYSVTCGPHQTGTSHPAPSSVTGRQTD
ncbi:hypothetical protein L3Q82_012890 [Scortum barcoo]|uniref:Uncharacterized protein n=1 Tax=Scortum barcoo TaxID=214431 RepID=A0ACB8VYS9_9TELE|nr:hypothetical protein L3Q82_012890 [Scortum barcoo]